MRPEPLISANHPPEEDGEYLAKCEDANGGVFFNVLYYQTREHTIVKWDKYYGETRHTLQPGWYGSQRSDPTVDYTKLVKAWMPLPE